jgi:hypothetical protein
LGSPPSWFAPWYPTLKIVVCRNTLCYPLSPIIIFLFLFCLCFLKKSIYKEFPGNCSKSIHPTLAGIFLCKLAITHQAAGRSPAVVSALPGASPVAYLYASGLVPGLYDWPPSKEMPALPGGVGGFYGGFHRLRLNPHYCGKVRLYTGLRIIF